MNLFYLSWKNLVHKPLTTLLSIILFALGVGIISLLLLLNTQLEEKFEKNLAGINLVIGAKGSPLQLILCSMYHVDYPTGNISIEEAAPFLRPNHPLIEKSIPLSLGDSHERNRIVGTEHTILSLYDAEIGEGRLWESNMEVTVGAITARRLNLSIGDTFFGSHGFVRDENLVHSDAPVFTVVGILKPSGAVIDQLILCSTESIWSVHGETSAIADSSETDLPLYQKTDQYITSLLVDFKGVNTQTLNMQRAINENTSLQAASPAVEINRLYSNIGAGTDALRVLAIIIMVVSGLSIFISLYNSLKSRKYELSLMRVMGATPGKITRLILLEGLLLALIGWALGMMLSHGGMELLAANMQDAYQYSFTGWRLIPEELWLFIGAMCIGLIAALLPALQAGRTNISETLSEGK